MTQVKAPCQVKTVNTVVRTDKEGKRQEIKPGKVYNEHDQAQLDYLLKMKAVTVFTPDPVEEIEAPSLKHATGPANAEEAPADEEAADDEAAGGDADTEPKAGKGGKGGKKAVLG